MSIQKKMTLSALSKFGSPHFSISIRIVFSRFPLVLAGWLSGRKASLFLNRHDWPVAGRFQDHRRSLETL